MTGKALESWISIAEAMADVDALFDRVEAGETFILTRDGKPVVWFGPPPRKKVYPDRGFGISDEA